jgi:putative nucleotidyltransferase with HDIG domain
MLLDSAYKTSAQMTDTAREAVRNSVPTIRRTFRVGDVIVERGQVITENDSLFLRHQGYVPNEFPGHQLFVVCSLIMVTPLLLGISAGESNSRRRGLGWNVFEDIEWSGILLVIIVSWVCETIASRLDIVGAGILVSVMLAYLSMPRQYAFVVCVAAGILQIFIIIGLDISDMLFLLLFEFAAAMCGFYALRRVSSRENLAYKIFALAFSLTLLRAFARVYQGYDLTWDSLSLWPPGEAWRDGSYFLFFELATTFLAIIFLPIVENFIGVFSVLRMRELTHPSSPLLRKLQTEAPGTYHHCLMIGTLAEAVSAELGMNENLMKTGAYYHDIGKLRRPQYFVENQMGGENIHDKISPALSAMTIIAHVREGIELADEFGLPRRVKQFISEHHGTTTLVYFYKKALAAGQKVEPEQFRYPGPKPHSRETALLMLLDSSEAAIRAESGKIASMDDIKEIVERVVGLKIAEGQFDSADFTFSEITRVKAALLKAFQSMYHTRVVKQLEEKSSASGGN